MSHLIENINVKKLSAEKDKYIFINSNSCSLPGEDLNSYIQGCVLNDRLSQKKLYQSFYNYAMTICSRYAKNPNDAIEILNDGFLKVFKEIYRFNPAYTDLTNSFKGWFRKIMIHTAIDHFRKNNKHCFTKELNSEANSIMVCRENVLDKISYDEIIKAINKLTSGYRLIFNLFVIDGYTHEEIGKQLGISTGSSKSGLSRGRKQLQKILYEESHISFSSN